VRGEKKGDTQSQFFREEHGSFHQAVTMSRGKKKGEGRGKKYNQKNEFTRKKKRG